VSDDEAISYEEFGRNFIEHVVTTDRVAAAVGGVAGKVDERKLSLGPGGAVRAGATVELADVEVERVAERPLVRFVALLHLRIQLKVSVAGAPHRYKGTVSVRLTLTVRTVAPLSLHIDIDEPSADDVEVRLEGADLRSRVVQGIGNVDDQVGAVVLATVREQLRSPAAHKERFIDLLDLVEDAWRPDR
jgi:hypothetical protein